MRDKLSLRRRSERGQGFMELAVSLIFLLILLAAVIDLGWAFYTMIALRDAAQEAASYGAMCPTDAGKITTRLRLSASAPLDMDDIPAANVTVSIVDPQTGLLAPVALGNSVKVEVWVNHHIVTPFVGSFIGMWDYPLRVSVSDTIMRVDCLR